MTECEGEGGGEAQEEALRELRAAEADLAEAREEEGRAEAKEHDALSRIEKAAEILAEDEREIPIMVNGRPKIVTKKKQSYRDIARLAYPDADFNQYLYTITFFNGEHPKEGDLVEGERVTVKKGTVFNVRRSDKS